MPEAISTYFEAVIAGDEQAIKLLAAAYFATAFFLSFIYQLRIRSWPMTPGALAEKGLDRWGASMRADEQNYEANVRYQYSVDGVSYDCDRLSPWVVFVTANLRFVLNWQLRGIRKLSDDRVEVFYNPSNPKKSFLVKPGNIGLSITAGVVLLSVASIFLLL